MTFRDAFRALFGPTRREAACSPEEKEARRVMDCSETEDQRGKRLQANSREVC